MDQHCAAFSEHADAAPDQVTERMRRVDPLVRQWVDPAFRGRIDPDMAEVVGPPARISGRRLRRV